jgi:hypothetical protein
MELSKDNRNNEVVLRLKERELLTIIGALAAAASDDKRKEPEYSVLYEAEKGEVVALWNALRKANC